MMIFYLFNTIANQLTEEELPVLFEALIITLLL